MSRIWRLVENRATKASIDTLKRAMKSEAKHRIGRAAGRSLTTWRATDEYVSIVLTGKWNGNNMKHEYHVDFGNVSSAGYYEKMRGMGGFRTLKSAQNFATKVMSADAPIKCFQAPTVVNYK